MYGGIVHTFLQFFSVQPKVYELVQLTFRPKLYILAGICKDKIMVVVFVLADGSQQCVAFIRFVVNVIVGIVLYCQRQLNGGRLKIIVALVICRHCNGEASGLLGNAVNFTGVGIQFQSFRQGALHLEGHSVPLIHIVGGHCVGVRHILDGIVQRCGDDGRVQGTAGQPDHHRFLTIRLNGQCAFDLALTVRQQADFCQVGQFPIPFGGFGGGKGSQRIIAFAAHRPVIVQLDMGGIQRDLQAGQFLIAHIGNQDIMLFLEIFVQENRPLRRSADIQFGAMFLLDKADLISLGMVVNDGGILHRTVGKVLGAFAGDLFAAHRRPYTFRIRHLKHRLKLRQVHVIVIDQDGLIAVAVHGIHVDFLAVFHNIDIVQRLAVIVGARHTEPGVLCTHNGSRCELLHIIRVILAVISHNADIELEDGTVLKENGKVDAAVLVVVIGRIASGRLAGVGGQQQILDIRLSLRCLQGIVQTDHGLGDIAVGLVAIFRAVRRQNAVVDVVRRISFLQHVVQACHTGAVHLAGFHVHSQAGGVPGFCFHTDRVHHLAVLHRVHVALNVGDVRRNHHSVCHISQAIAGFPVPIGQHKESFGLIYGIRHIEIAFVAGIGLGHVLIHDLIGNGGSGLPVRCQILQELGEGKDIHIHIRMFFRCGSEPNIVLRRVSIRGNTAYPRIDGHTHQSLQLIIDGDRLILRFQFGPVAVRILLVQGCLNLVGYRVGQVHFYQIPFVVRVQLVAAAHNQLHGVG